MTLNRRARNRENVNIEKPSPSKQLQSPCPLRAAGLLVNNIYNRQNPGVHRVEVKPQKSE